MDHAIKESLWKQFGASIDMLKNIISICPEELFTSHKKLFYITYHSLVFLDYYLTIPPPAKFSSPLPFTLAGPADIPEDAIDDVVPDRFYSKIELLDYVLASRQKCYRLIMDLTEEKMNERFIEEPGTGNMNYSTFEILLYNMRHVQHHVGQLNMLLRKHINHTTGWVARAGEE